MKCSKNAIKLLLTLTLISSPLASNADGMRQINERNKEINRKALDGTLGNPGKESGGIFVKAKKKPGSICESDVKKNAQNFLNNLIPDVCGNINTNPDPSNSKYMYKNPDGGCDIGLELPGLPSFGGSFSGISSCQIVKAVTGDMVDRVNDTVNGAWDGAVNMAKDKIRQKTGLDADNLNFDMGQIAEDAIDGK